MSSRFEKLAQEVVRKARRRGATEAEVFLEWGRHADVKVRDGEVEELSQATAKGLGLRVLRGKRLGFAWTSDFEKTSLDAFVDKAIALADASAPNAHAGLPSRSEQGRWPTVEGLYDPAIAELAADWKLKTALELERVVRSEQRVKTVESVGAGEAVNEVYLASSTGAHGTYQATSAYLYACPVASDGDQLQTAAWYDAKRRFADLDGAEAVGREAARRSVALLGAKKVQSCRVPVVFDPTVAAGFFGAIAGALNGDAVRKRATFLAGKLGQAVAPKSVTLVDDGLRPSGLRSAPFDGEGVAAQRTQLISQGTIAAYLYDATTARKVKGASTGNAVRGYRSLPSIGSTNLYLEAGTQSREELLRGVADGFYVTSMLGSGANLVTGEYSRGANGLWIQNGELTYPVHEVTVAGNLLDMLANIDAIADDLDFRGSVAAPTIRFKQLTVSGA